jgi:NADH-quinone oxidoreductase subunit L
VPLDVGVGGILLTTGLAAAGVAATLVALRRRPADDPVTLLGRAASPLRHAFYVDALYDRVLVRPLNAVARGAPDVDRRRVDAVVTGTGRATTLMGAAVRLTQSGNIQGYLSALVLGVLVVVVAVSWVVAA